MISEAFCHSSKGNLTENVEDIYFWYGFEND